MQASSSPTSTGAVEDLVTALYRLGIVQREIARHALAGLGSQGFTALAVDPPLRPRARLRRRRAPAHRPLRREPPGRRPRRAGYAEREPDPDDRRAYRVAVTELGAEVLRESHRRMVEAFARPLAGWEDDDIAALAAGLAPAARRLRRPGDAMSRPAPSSA